MDDKIRAYLEENHITTKPYDAIYDYVPEIPADAVVLIFRRTVNYRIVNSLDKAIKVVDKPNPTELMKAVKNKTEVDNTRAAHVKTVPLPNLCTGSETISEDPDDGDLCF